MLSNVHLNWPVVASCRGEIEKYCPARTLSEGGTVSMQPPQHVSCLQEHSHEEGFSASCRSKVAEVTRTQLSDVRLNTGLLHACQEAAASLCGLKGQMAAGLRLRGKVLECLREKEVSPSRAGSAASSYCMVAMIVMTCERCT